jgi:hypothetical protein
VELMVYLLDEDKYSQNPSYFEEELSLVVGDVKNAKPTNTVTHVQTKIIPNNKSHTISQIKSEIKTKLKLKYFKF